MKYYIADTHFGHANIIKYDGRPFRNVDEMDEYLIKAWNDRVTDNDDIYILGDFAMMGHNRDACWYLRQLHGKKHLVIGNHESAILDNSKAKAFFCDMNYIKEVSDTLNNANVRIVLCHYPLAEWNGMYKGWYHIYGHIHNNPKGRKRRSISMPDPGIP